MAVVIYRVFFLLGIVTLLGFFGLTIGRMGVSIGECRWAAFLVERGCLV